MYKGLKIGVLLNTLKADDLSINIVTALNKLTQEGFSVNLFVDNIQNPLISPAFNITQQVDAFSYDGILISTNIDNYMVMNKCFTSKKRFHYIWDFIYTNEFAENKYIYCNQNIKYITRSTLHQNILQKTWNQNSIIIEDFNYEQIAKLCRNS